MTLAQLALLFILFILYHTWWKRRGLPPGPMPWPLVGNFPQIDLANPHRTLLKWKKIYGPVFTIWTPKPIVVIAEYAALEQALVGEADAFAARPSSFLYRLFTGAHHEGDGIILSSGKRWQTQRQFALRTLKTFGFGKGEMETKINFHLDQLLEQFETEIVSSNLVNKSAILEEGYINPHHPLAFCIGNIIHDLVLGKVQSVSLLVADSFPWLAPFLPAYYRYRRNGMALQQFFLDQIDAHSRYLSLDGPPRDFMDAYLREQRAHPHNPHFNRLTLALNAGDLWTGGMETTVTTIRWGIIYLIRAPFVQSKMFDEIDNKLGDSRVAFADRDRMPYTCAVIAELQRIANVLPWNIPHCTSRRTSAGHFALDEGTDVMPAIGAVHHDEELWGPDSEDFDPERFLSVNGAFAPPAFFAPFGLGKRACLGENLAKMELFLIFTTLVQHYEFSEGDRALPSLHRTMGMTSVPQEYTCLVKRRRN